MYHLHKYISEPFQIKNKIIVRKIFVLIVNQTEFDWIQIVLVYMVWHSNQYILSNQKEDRQYDHYMSFIAIR